MAYDMKVLQTMIPFKGLAAHVLMAVLGWRHIADVCVVPVSKNKSKMSGTKVEQCRQGNLTPACKLCNTFDDGSVQSETLHQDMCCDPLLP